MDFENRRSSRTRTDLPAFENEPPAAVKEHFQKWLSAHRLSHPIPESSVVVHGHFADNGTYGMVEELAQHLPELAGPCMAVKGLKYKREW